MEITLTTDNGDLTTATVQPTDPINTLSPAIASAFSIPANRQSLLFNSAPLDPASTFTAAGISNGDLIMVAIRPAAPSAAAPAGQPTARPAGAPTAVPPGRILSVVRGNPQLLAQIRATAPALAARIDANDPSVEAELASALNRAAGGALPFLSGGGGGGGAGGGGAGPPGEQLDPFSADGQRAIEARIRAENVQENMEAALEHNPESFGRVVMLFVDCKLNDNPGVKAFVDSGAQTTIISKACAERCNVLRLLDSRFEGVARGVGTAKIYGRIHLALLTLGKEVFEISLTVMDAVGGGYDMLLGLDMLRKHAAVIDLGADVLRIGGEAVPFLAEKDIPRAMRDSDPPTEEELKETSDKAAGADAAASGSGSAAPTATGPSAAARPQPAGSAPATGGGAASAAQPDKAKVKQLIDMGFSEHDAVQALQMCNGDADQAAAVLAANKYGL